MVADQAGAPRSGNTVSPAVVTAVVDTYYPEAVRAGGSARIRAQAAQSVATVFAAGLVTTLTLTGMESQVVPVRIFGCSAVIFWVIAAALYMHAVGKLIAPKGQASSVDDDDALVREVLQRATDERNGVDKWQLRANIASSVALLFTAATFIGTAWLPGKVDLLDATLLLTPEQRQLIPAGCRSMGDTVEGRVDILSLRRDFAEFVVSCEDGDEFILRLPKKDLKGVKTDE